MFSNMSPLSSLVLPPIIIPQSQSFALQTPAMFQMPMRGPASNEMPAASQALSASTAPTQSNPMSGMFQQIMQLFTMMQFMSMFDSSSGDNSTPDTTVRTGTSKLDHDDLVNYFLAGSRGGTTSTVEVIEGRYARPGSRFAEAGANEFDAVTAYAYAGQFKAYALGLDVVFNPGESPDTLADNLKRAIETEMTPEAELLSKVAAVYRGDLTGVNAYDNGALRDLLVQWGRSDLANKPGAGRTDVESIGGVIQALNEEKDPAIRQRWLQQIFDFAGNTPTSPSGAVPNARAYQDAITIVRDGRLDELLDNYRRGIKTGSGADGTQPGTVRPVP